MGRGRFRALVAADVSRLLQVPALSLGPEQVAARWPSLPDPVRRYLRYAVPEQAPAIHAARLKHDGFFRTKPGQRWFRIHGEEYFTLSPPGFVWHGAIRLAPLLRVEARDCLISGRGNMLVKFNSIFTLADAGGPQIAQGAHARWLAEAVWFPLAFVGDGIQWEPIDNGSARVTLVQDGLPVSAVVEFDSEGKAVRVRGERYRAVEGGTAVLTPWYGRCTDYRDFSGLRVPSSVEVAWGLSQGQFSYARFRVTELAYDLG